MKNKCWYNNIKKQEKKRKKKVKRKKEQLWRKEIKEITVDMNKFFDTT